MTKVLIIDSAATGDASVSRKLTAEFAERLSEREPDARIVRRDIGTATIPHLTAETVGAIRGAATTDAERATLALSDDLIGELKEADLIVIGAPMYNFGMSSTLKTWFDHVLRSGVTFRYTAEGPEGLVTGKKALVIETRAGLYSEGGPAGAMEWSGRHAPGMAADGRGPSALDHQEPHIRTLLGFMGITDVKFVRAEKLAFGPEAAEASVADAARQLGGCAEIQMALAA
jgi:FMN-dependent NADH-azoreductase